MRIHEIIDRLRDFKRVDKYEAFQKILPEVTFVPGDQKDALQTLLDNCCMDLLNQYQPGKKPAKAVLKQIISKYMDEIAAAPFCVENKEFGYELCWFLSEKVNINMKKSSENRIWGFWKIVAGEVITIQRKRRSY